MHTSIYYYLVAKIGADKAENGPSGAKTLTQFCQNNLTQLGKATTLSEQAA